VPGGEKNSQLVSVVKKQHPTQTIRQTRGERQKGKGKKKKKGTEQKKQISTRRGVKERNDVSCQGVGGRPSKFGRRAVKKASHIEHLGKNKKKCEGKRGGGKGTDERNKEN